MTLRADATAHDQREQLGHEAESEMSSLASLDALFRRQARRTPDHVAVTHGQAALSYRELDARVDELCGALIASGVTRGSRVVLCAVRSVELVVGMLATLRAGAAYVPIDPETPSRRVRSVIEQVEPALLLISSVRIL